ncbi:MAG: hypothetical protein ACK4PK_06520 [Alphaproteobacteria bacterium]
MTRFFFFLIALSTALLFEATPARSETPAATEAVIPHCPQDRATHECVIDLMIDAFEPYDSGPLPLLWGHHRAATLDKPFEHYAAFIAQHGTPEQRQRMLAILDVRPGKLFLPAKKESRGSQLTSALSAKLLLLSSLNKSEEVLSILRRLQKNPDFRPERNYDLPQHKIINFYIGQQNIEASLRAINDLYDMTFHAGSLASVSGDRATTHTNPFDNLITDLLLSGRYHEARNLTKKLKPYHAKEHNPRRALLIAAQARDADGGKDNDTFRSFCWERISTANDTQRKYFEYAYPKEMAAIILAQCLRAGSDFARALPPAQLTENALPGAWGFQGRMSAAQAIASFQRAYDALENIEKNNLSLSGKTLAEVTYLRPEVAADACRRIKSDSCLQEVFMQLDARDAQTPAAPRDYWRIFSELSGREFFAPDTARLKREFGLLPPLPVSTLVWESPASREKTTESLRVCETQKNEVHILTYVGCMMRAAQDAIGNEHKMRHRLFLRQMYLINPHRDWEEEMKTAAE